MNYSDVTALKWSKATIYSVAEQVRNRLLPRKSDDVEGAIAFLGGSVFYQGVSETNKSNDGSIVIDDVGSFKIFVPDYVSRERNRFTLAHELGHYILHYIMQERQGQRVKAARTSSERGDRAEWEANWFAAGFLMPKSDFAKAVTKHDGDIVGVARQFGVSVQAAKVHADFHGLEV